jgi:dihydrolipoamide dehydrogenase
MEKYDVCVVGCGPGGYAAAVRGLDFGKKVLIVEANQVGGAGIMHGAMTSKTMWELSQDYAIAAETDRGYRAASLSVDYSAVRDTVIQAAKTRQHQILSQIETFSPTNTDREGSLTLKKGKGRFKSQHVLEIEKDTGEIEEIYSTFFVISTGSRPRPLSCIAYDGERVISSDGVLSLKKFPKRLMIVGAGIIGCEFGTIFSNYGQTKVHILDRQDRIIPFEDPDLSEFLEKNFRDKKVEVHHNASLRNVFKKADGLEVIIDYNGGYSEVVEVDVVFGSIGRIPNTDQLNLEAVGVQCNERGHIQVDNNMCANDNIYAVGDITGNAALANFAEMEGRFAIKAMFGKVVYPLKYNNMSSIMFFSPEVAVVGLNESQAREQKIPHKVAYLSLALVNRAIAMRSTDGFVKILVSKDEKPKILGMRAAGPRASDLIMSIAIAMDRGSSLGDVMATTQPHPSISEATQCCLRMLMGKSIDKPRAFPHYMKVHSWTPEGGETTCIETLS